MNTYTRFSHLSLAIAAVLLFSGCSGGTSSVSLSDNSGQPGQTQTGIAGSTARMVIDGNNLYAISGNTVQLFDITQPSTPVAGNQVIIDWNIETLFPYENYLLVGAADGIHILDNTDPASPRYVSDFEHAVTRDPVVAQNDVAYVTLRRDDTLFNGTNENSLNIVDISDVENPQLIQTQELSSPSGLSVRGEELYVCDGDAGLTVFDISDKFAPVAKQILRQVNCNDVIATDNTLHVIGPLDYSQYARGAVNARPTLLSTIKREPVIYLVDR